MNSVFTDQSLFMKACDQSVGKPDARQMSLYIKLIEEELDELKTAMGNDDVVGMLDGVIDVLVTTIGAGLSRFGVDQLDLAWKEIFDSNMSKLDPATGLAIKREDGKVLKGPNYFKPNLEQFV